MLNGVGGERRRCLDGQDEAVMIASGRVPNGLRPAFFRIDGFRRAAPGLTSAH
jgi:hypothetical protein